MLLISSIFISISSQRSTMALGLVSHHELWLWRLLFKTLIRKLILYILYFFSAKLGYQLVICRRLVNWTHHFVNLAFRFFQLDSPLFVFYISWKIVFTFIDERGYYWLWLVNEQILASSVTCSYCILSVTRIVGSLLNALRWKGWSLGGTILICSTKR